MELKNLISSQQKNEILPLLRSRLIDNQIKGVLLCEKIFPLEYHCRKNVLLGQQAGYWRIMLEDDESFQIWTYTLDLSENFFQDIPLKTLEKFFNGNYEILMRKNGLKEFPRNIKEAFSYVSGLDISDNQIQKLNIESSLRQLNALNANNNQIFELQQDTEVENLTRLWLSNNQIKEIPSDYFVNFTKLTFLDISKNQIEYFPIILNWVCSSWRYTGRKEAHLVSLNASHNQMAYFDIIHHENQNGDNYYSKKKDLPVFYNFKRLLLQHNLLNTLPHEFFNDRFNQNLQILNLSHNQFRALPEKFSTLPKLKWFNISYNQLENLVLPLESPLKTLLAIHNFLESLPTEIGNLKTLEKIHLQNNKITELPMSIGNLKALKELRLYNNQLQYLPDTFQNLQNLEHLSLGKNNFEEAPHVLSKLKKLKTLDIGENPLPQKEIEKIQKLLPDTKINT